jgi:hypothetical protein
VADSYDFNDHAYRRFVERLKVWYPICDSTFADGNNRIRLIRKVFYHQGSREFGLQNIGSSVSACNAKTWSGATSASELFICMGHSSLWKNFFGLGYFLLLFSSAHFYTASAFPNMVNYQPRPSCLGKANYGAGHYVRQEISTGRSSVVFPVIALFLMGARSRGGLCGSHTALFTRQSRSSGQSQLGPRCSGLHIALLIPLA